MPRKATPKKVIEKERKQKQREVFIELFWSILLEAFNADNLDKLKGKKWEKQKTP